MVAVSPSKVCIWFNNKQEHMPFSLRLQKTSVALSIKRLPDSLGREMKIYQILPRLSKMACQAWRQEKRDFLFFFSSPMLTSLGDPRMVEGERSACLSLRV